MIIIGASLVLATVISGAAPADSTDHSGMQLRGESLVEVGPFGLDVYIARFFSDTGGVRSMELEYLRDVAKEFSIMGWEKGLASFESSVYQGAIEWILAITPDLLKGDRLEMRVAGEATSVFVNGRLIGASDNPQVAELIHAPWIGDAALDSEVKKRLLGGTL